MNVSSDIILIPERTFRRTPGVHFADVTVEGSNGIDLVEHKGPAVSPPRFGPLKQFYVHTHQTDHNRCIVGSRLFELYCDAFHHPHWYVYLDDESGALRIPPGCYHRSISGPNGSTLLNHAIRDSLYDETREFIPKFSWGAFATPALFYGITPERAHDIFGV